MTEYEKSYWDYRYSNGGNSGEGSYGSELIQKIHHLQKLDFDSITDVGCGDFNLSGTLMKVHPVKSYVGLDVSEYIVKRNIEKFPDYRFKLLGDVIPPADLVLCMDVLFHVIEDSDCEELLNKLEESWIKYLVLTAYERYEEFDNHVRIRKFDPSRFGTPIVREIIERDGDKYLYIFKK